MIALLLTGVWYCKAVLPKRFSTSLCTEYALFVTDRVCAEPLTDAVHFNDLLHANPQHVEATARLLKSLALDTNKLYSEMQMLKERPAPLQRSERLTLGGPYPLHNTLR